MTELSNNFKHTIDSKNRLFIPAKYRQLLGESFYLYYEPGSPCVAVYDAEEWAKRSQKVIESHNVDWQRFVFSNVVPVEPDKQGRITVKASFCEGAGLKKDVAVVGVGDRVEIWDAEKYEKEIETLNTSAKQFPSLIG